MSRKGNDPQIRQEPSSALRWGGGKGEYGTSEVEEGACGGTCKLETHKAADLRGGADKAGGTCKLKNFENLKQQTTDLRCGVEHRAGWAADLRGGVDKAGGTCKLKNSANLKHETADPRRGVDKTTEEAFSANCRWTHQLGEKIANPEPIIANL